MLFPSIFFKDRGKSSLKGNWQTALLVTFFSGALMLLQELVSTMKLPSTSLLANGQVDLYLMELLTITRPMWWVMLALSVLNLLFSPALSLSCTRYFLNRVRGEQPSLMDGLFGQMRYFLKALWLYILIGVRVFLWSLLFVIPGILAALRYSMAFYYLADDPSLSAGQAIAKSKELMKPKGMKPSYFLLLISFIGWTLLSNVAQLLLYEISPVLAMVVVQGLQLYISTYMNAARAAFYVILTTPSQKRAVFRDIYRQLRDIGVSESDLDAESQMPPEEDDEEDDQP